MSKLIGKNYVEKTNKTPISNYFNYTKIQILCNSILKSSTPNLIFTFNFTKISRKARVSPTVYYEDYKLST